MEKINVVVSCPIDTYSGYGARSRDVVKALIETGKYNVKVLAQRWGSTRFGYLEDHNELELRSIIIPNITAKPDVWIQITVPNEFQPIGKFNIGITAGIETTACDPSWIEGCNRMNLILTSSNHSKNVFQTTAYSTEQQGRPAGKLKLTTPVEVLFEGVDLEKYWKTDTKGNMEINLALDTLEESFCYLFVGHWLQGELGEDRKNIGYTVKMFLETFANKKQAPALVLKTQSANASILDRNKMLETINSIRKQVKGTLPNIYLLHGEISDSEMNELYNHPKVKAMVNLTKGEGFGRPLLEFSTVNKPIITSNWSGHTDFLSTDYNVMVGGKLTNVHPSAAVKNIILEDSQWFTPNDNEVVFAFKDVVENYKKYSELAKRQGYRTRTEFSYEKMREQLDSILSTTLPSFPKEVSLSLPTLQLPKLQKIDG